MLLACLLVPVLSVPSRAREAACRLSFRACPLGALRATAGESEGAVTRACLARGRLSFGKGIVSCPVGTPFSAARALFWQGVSLRGGSTMSLRACVRQAEPQVLYLNKEYLSLDKSRAHGCAVGLRT